MGENYPKMQCSITIATLSIFGAKTEIALTGVCSRVREYLTSQLIYYFTFNSVLFCSNLLISLYKVLSDSS